MASAPRSSLLTYHRGGKRVLAVDAGNSRIKWGLHDGEGWLVQDWIATAHVARIGRAWAGLSRPEIVIASNVAGGRGRRSLGAGAGRLRLPGRVARGQGGPGEVRRPDGRAARLGADRWAALIGAWHLFHGPCVVVNAGTTMTVDALSAEGVFLGGMIVAGVELMRVALARSTAQLKVQAGRYAYFPGRTSDAIISGAV